MDVGSSPRCGSHFVSTSPHASALEQLKVVVNQVKATHKEPVRTYDADTGRPCSFRLGVPDGPVDNPQQAEEASHMGHQANYFCRRCKVGGTHEERECPDKYYAFYEIGKPRNVEEIRECVLRQLQLATYGIAALVEALQTATKMHAALPGRDPDLISNELMVCLTNPLLDLPYLHTILLGDAKYTWYDLHHNWTPVQQDIFTIWLQSTNLDGLGVPLIRAAYMMQYRNGLIGKHIKTLMQTTIFHIHDIVTPNQFTLVRALGELGPIFWTAVIDDMEEYLCVQYPVGFPALHT
ncbi:hypothetical protein B0H10DRAFT_2166368 [Mycena sp. CBHHK59/15]|nr:hypothetical protein B0H10DRAFT_2166368 [Mycena sp. CBHHK59/15]